MSSFGSLSHWGPKMQMVFSALDKRGIGYVHLAPHHFRELMNEITGMNVPGNTHPEDAAEQWLTKL